MSVILRKLWLLPSHLQHLINEVLVIRLVNSHNDRSFVHFLAVNVFYISAGENLSWIDVIIIHDDSDCLNIRVHDHVKNFEGWVT